VTTLEDALVRLANTRPPATPESIVRVEVDRSERLVVTLQRAGQTRWLRQSCDDFAEIFPHDDTRVPLCAQVGPTSEVLSWRAGRRVVFAEAGAVRKGYRRKRLPAALARQGALEPLRAAGSRLHFPKVASVDEQLASITFERIEGSPLSISAGDASLFERIGAGLREMHSIQALELPHFDVRSELERLQSTRERCAAYTQFLHADWDPLFERCAAVASEFENARRGLVHGDLHDGQFLIQRGTPFLLDFDQAASGPPAMDVGNLLAHLDLRALQELCGASARSVRACASALLAGWQVHSEHEQLELDFYQATTNMRLALVYAIRPHWRALAPALLVRAQAQLEACTHGH
jgi:aminoglycoside phosphotransferase (APT) family kinase protein